MSNLAFEKADATRGFFSGLYPSTKLIFAGVFTILSVFLSWKFSYFIVLPLCLLIALVDRKFVSYAKKVFLALIVFVLFIIVFQFILDTSTTNVILDLKFMRITEEGLLAGLNQTKVLVTLISTLILFFETTDIELFMISLQKQNVSHVVTYIVLSTLQLIPDMAKKSSVIMEAQQARGIETEGSVVRRMKAFFPSLGPLVISSITDIEDRSITLEVRGFSSENKKTSLKNIDKSGADTIIVVLLIAVFIGGLVWRFAL